MVELIPTLSSLVFSFLLFILRPCLDSGPQQVNTKVVGLDSADTTLHISKFSALNIETFKIFFIVY